jgi:hypothetical protein
MTKGGDGGDTFSEKSLELQERTRSNMSLSSSGNKNGFYNKHHSKETKEQLSKSHKGLIPWIKGKKHKKQSIIEISQSLLGDKNKRYVQLTNKQIEEIIDLYVNKKNSITQIQKITKLNYYKIKKVLFENGIKFKNIYKI